ATAPSFARSSITWCRTPSTPSPSATTGGSGSSPKLRATRPARCVPFDSSSSISAAAKAVSIGRGAEREASTMRPPARAGRKFRYHFQNSLRRCTPGRPRRRTRHLPERFMATILVVDDELGIRALLSEILADEGHTVELAEDAAQARACRERFRPDLVLLDIWMPDVDGITLLKEWGSATLLTMPVIMMSGHGTIDTAVEATKFGAIAFLEKPITL